MIKVLQNWQEIGEATLNLQRNNLPSHASICKNWDHFYLYNILQSRDKHSKIVDLGCGEGYTLKFVHALGFTNIHGIDFQISWRLRISQILKFWKNHSLPYQLHKGDITSTYFADESYDIALSLSVIEHGVNIEKFFKEAYRILNKNGILIITTDYWEEKIITNKDIRVYGLQWNVFSHDEIEKLISLAEKIGFRLQGKTSLPKCCDKNIIWQNQEYTFIALSFVKSN